MRRLLEGDGRRFAAFDRALRLTLSAPEMTALIGGMRALVNLIAFVAILWGLSGTLTLPLGWFSVALPGYMVWVALLYAMVGTWVTHWIGNPLVRLNFDRQRCEADFRFGLVRFRENTEGVALYRGLERMARGLGDAGDEIAGLGHDGVEQIDLVHATRG